MKAWYNLYMSPVSEQFPTLTELENLLWFTAGPGFTGLPAEEMPRSQDSELRQQLFALALQAVNRSHEFPECLGQMSAGNCKRTLKALQGGQSPHRAIPSRYGHEAEYDDEQLVLSVGSLLRSLVQLEGFTHQPPGAATQEPEMPEPLEPEAAETVRAQEQEDEQPSIDEIRLDDDQLCAAVRQGDQASFSVLWLRHRGLATAVAIKTLRHSSHSLHHDAETAVADTGLALYQALMQPGNTIRSDVLNGWVAAVARHKAIDIWRQQSRIRDEPTDEIRELEPAVEPWTASQPEEHMLELENAAAAEAERAAVRQALSTLSKKQQEIAMLYDGLGWSAERVADATNSTPGGVRVTAHRCRTKLREILALPQVTAGPNDSDDSLKAS